MPDPLGPPGCPYDPGNAGIARGIDVRTSTLHRTIGHWAGDYSVGKNRSHNDGTFQHLIGQNPGEWVQFYPINTFCSHAAGANEAGPGIEISGQNGEPLTDWQIDALGQILRWERDEWGIAPTFTDGDPRVWIDQAGPSGFVTHRHVAYPPRTSFQHYDYITADEFARALAPAPPAPSPPPSEGATVKVLSNATQVNTFSVDDTGNLVTRYYPQPKGPWGAFTIVGGCRPGTSPEAEFGLFDDPARIDVFADGAGGGVVHAWFPGDHWYSEVL